MSRDPIKPGQHGSTIRAIRTTLALALLCACGTNASPAVARPLRPEALDAAVAALVDTHIATARNDPNSAQRHGELGLVYEANSLWPEARAAFTTAASLDPTDVVWAYHRALAMLQEGAYERSVQELRRIAQAFPGFAPAVHRLGDALLETEDLDGAEGAFRSALRLAPKAPEVHVGLGQVALRRGDYPEAVEHLERALALDPRYAMAHFLIGKAYRGVGRDEAARRALALGVDAKKRFLPDAGTAQLAQYATGMVSQLNRARALLDAGQPRAALELLEQANAMRPGRPEILNYLAIAYGTLDDLDGALRILEESKQADEANALTRVNLALAYLEKGAPEEALKNAVRATELQPESGRAQLTKGAALMALRRFEAARPALAQALALNPSDTNAHLLLGETCFRLDRLEEAEEHLLESARRQPRNPSTHVFLAYTRIKLDKIDEAWESVRAAQALAPKHTDVLALTRHIESLRR